MRLQEAVEFLPFCLRSGTPRWPWSAATWGYPPPTPPRWWRPPGASRACSGPIRYRWGLTYVGWAQNTLFPALFLPRKKRLLPISDRRPGPERRPLPAGHVHLGGGAREDRDSGAQKRGLPHTWQCCGTFSLHFSAARGSRSRRTSGRWGGRTGGRPRTRTRRYTGCF